MLDSQLRPIYYTKSTLVAFRPGQEGAIIGQIADDLRRSPPTLAVRLCS